MCCRLSYIGLSCATFLVTTQDRRRIAHELRLIPEVAEVDQSVLCFVPVLEILHDLVIR